MSGPLFASTRSPFRVIDPVTEEYHRGPDLSSTSASKRSQAKRPSSFFAISYVWSDWKEDVNAPLPSWDLIRNRLLYLSTTNVFSDSAAAASSQPDAFRCWIDCKCIDQASATDKAYWVPRMNQVFFNSRCTILLLRHFDLTGIFELHRITKCRFSESGGANGTSTGDGTPQHRCLFDPSCISLVAPIPEILEALCLETLAALWNGAWRKRAWIFQEILLSERYILSWGDAAMIAYIDLETIGYIAAFLQSRHPEARWLHEFWTWCKQCAYIRQFYAENCDMEATIFQLAENLEATLPCDKYYALCGVLGLDGISYDPVHTESQALDNIVSALTRQGRMGWMYAIPPSINEGVLFSPQSMAPFVLTRKKRQKSADVREPFFSNQLLGVLAVELGSVNGETNFDQLLRQVHSLEDSMSQFARSPNRRQNFLKECYTTASSIQRQFPGILFRLGYDIVGPLCEANLLRVLFRTLDRSGLNAGLFEKNLDCCLWFVVIRLCFISSAEMEHIGDPEARQVVWISAQHLQALCHKLCSQTWKILQWQRAHDPTKPIPVNSEPRLAAFNGTLPTFGKSVWSVQTKQSTASLTFIAGELQPLVPDNFNNPNSPISPMASMMSIDSKTEFKPIGIASLSSNASLLRSEFSDTSLCFYGLTYQIGRAPYSLETYKSAFHDSVDERDTSDDLYDRLKLGMKSMSRLKGTSSGSRLSSSQAKRSRFLTFQRRDRMGPPRALSPFPGDPYGLGLPALRTTSPPLLYPQYGPGTPQSFTYPNAPTYPTTYPNAPNYLPAPYNIMSGANYQPLGELRPQAPPFPYGDAPQYERYPTPFSYQAITPSPPPPTIAGPSTHHFLAELDATPTGPPPPKSPPYTPPRKVDFVQDMPKMAELREMFPSLSPEILLGIIGKHGPNLEAVLDDCFKKVAESPGPSGSQAHGAQSDLNPAQWDQVFREVETQMYMMAAKSKPSASSPGDGDAAKGKDIGRPAALPQPTTSAESDTSKGKAVDRTAALPKLTLSAFPPPLTPDIIAPSPVARESPLPSQQKPVTERSKAARAAVQSKLAAKAKGQETNTETENPSSLSPSPELQKKESYDTLYDAPREVPAPLASPLEPTKPEEPAKTEKPAQVDLLMDLIDLSDATSHPVPGSEPLSPAEPVSPAKPVSYHVDLLSLID